MNEPNNIHTCIAVLLDKVAELEAEKEALRQVLLKVRTMTTDLHVTESNEDLVNRISVIRMEIDLTLTKVNE